jgi:hypothetical protein
MGSATNQPPRAGRSRGTTDLLVGHRSSDRVELAAGRERSGARAGRERSGVRVHWLRAQSPSA